MSLKADRGDLRWALGAAVRHVCTDEFIHSLCGVRLEIVPAEHRLYCVATDRYTIGVATVDYEGDHDPIQLTVPTAEVRDLIRRLAGKGLVEVDITGHAVTVEDFYRFRVMPAEELPGTTQPPFINWRKLLATMLAHPDALPGAQIGYDPVLLARFSSVKRGSAISGALTVKTKTPDRRNGDGPGFPGEMKLKPPPPGSLALVLADNFAGAVMGVRNYDDEQAGNVRVTDWTQRLKVAEVTP